MSTTIAESVFGIKSFAAPIVFVLLYLPLLGLFLSKAVVRPSYVYIVLTLFCAIRVAAFVLRALLAHVTSDANNINVLVAYEILYNTGFFGLLYSAYILVTHRVALSSNPPTGPISRILRHHFLFRIALTAAVALGITGAVEVSTGTTLHTVSTGNTLRKAAIYIFLVCAILVLLQTYFLARTEFTNGSRVASSHPVGSTYGIYILFVISALLVAREAFFTATANDPQRQTEEALWYPLAVVTEYIAVALFAVPGLVPDSSKAS